MSAIRSWSWQSEIPWNTEIVLLCGSDLPAIRAAVKDRVGIEPQKLDERFNACHEFYHNGAHSMHFIMLFFEWDNTPNHIAVLVHEVLHLVFGMFKHNNYLIPKNTSTENDEELFNDYAQTWVQVMLHALTSPDEEPQKSVMQNRFLAQK